MLIYNVLDNQGVQTAYTNNNRVRYMFKCILV